MLLMNLGPGPCPGALAADSTKEEILAKYEKTVSRAEELNLYEQDVYQVLPKIRLASKALLAEDFDQAGRLLDDALLYLDVLASKKPVTMNRELRLEWMEIYFEIVQKLALLAFLAYLFLRWPRIRKQFAAERLSWILKTVTAVLAAVLGALFSLFDLSRYGESAWAFFDIQVVFAVAAGLLGGWLPGLAVGLGLAAFRWMLQPGSIVYPLVVLAAGLTGGVGAAYRRSFRRTGVLSFICGLAAGLIHGLLIYLPAAHWMKPFFLAFSIGFIALLEGTGVYVFFGMIAGILREDDRRQTEKDLWKTRLLFLQAQMNPHFVFNALNTISAVCAREKAGTAQRLVLRLSDFLRRTVKQDEEMVAVREELSYVDAYLELEAARYGDRLKIVRDIRIATQTWDFKIPLLVIQPVVENAIRHGVSKKEAGGTVSIGLRDEGGCLTLEVSDDGPGMTDARWAEVLAGKAESKEGAGVGLRNIHERLVRMYGISFGLKRETVQGGGMKIMVRVPMQAR